MVVNFDNINWCIRNLSQLKQAINSSGFLNRVNPEVSDQIIDNTIRLLENILYLCIEDGKKETNEM